MNLYVYNNPFNRNLRYCERDITINGVTIPKGTSIDIPVYGMGRDEEFWEDPLVFKLESFFDWTLNSVVW
uniref:Uncharacterized protein n=1 Tax=Ciona intestinalis TaxID=7719 RepID=H2XJK7_CIOIN